MENKLIYSVVAIFVIITLVGSVMIPILNDAENNTSDKITNTVTSSSTPGVYATYTLDGQDNYKLETAAAYSNYKINGETVNITRWDNVLQKVVTDKCRVEFNGHYMSVYDGTGTRIINVNNGSKNGVVEYTASTKTLTITIYTDLTNTAVDDTVTYTVNQIIYADPNGTYGAINTGGDPDVSYYVNDLNQVVAGGAYLTGDFDTAYFAEGETVYVADSSYTASATAITAAYGDYNDVITGSSYTVSVTDGNATETFTPFVVFVPMEITGHTSTQDSIISLYSVIPVLVIIALLVAVVVIIFSRRSD